jgi:transposase-like protein
MAFGRSFREKIKGETHYLWRAMDYEGEVLETCETNIPDRRAALKFFKKSMKRHGRSHVLVNNKLRSYGAVINEIGNGHRQETGRWLNNRAEDYTCRFDGENVQWKGFAACEICRNSSLFKPSFAPNSIRNVPQPKRKFETRPSRRSLSAALLFHA